MTFWRPVWYFQVCQWIRRLLDGKHTLKIKDASKCDHTACSHVTLVSTEDKKPGKIVVDRKLLELSRVLKNEALEIPPLSEIPVQMSKETLKKVIIGLQHFKEETEPFKTFYCRMKKRKMNAWERVFMDMGPAQLDALTTAAVYLDIVRLEILCYVKHAVDLRGKTTEEIRARYGFVNDFTPEEYKKVCAEKHWVLRKPFNEDEIGEEDDYDHYMPKTVSREN